MEIFLPRSIFSQQMKIFYDLKKILLFIDNEEGAFKLDEK